MLAALIAFVQGVGAQHRLTGRLDPYKRWQSENLRDS
jgi:hypothetical protein